ncbi:MAG: GAF domain-containing protein [Candidatus Krumholzibacteria bacterium]|nr:GAF domain-containing protein [Candidatus Krumholzibacteria bacterium]
MRAIAARSLASASRGLNGTKTVLQLRIIELVAFFMIVFVAREIADFDFKAHVFIILFLAAALLQIGGQFVYEYCRERFDAYGNRASTTLIWYSSALDFLTVIAIIYLTGTIESPFLFLLVVPLFFVSHIFTWRVTVGGYLTGAIATVAVFGYLELKQIIPHYNCYLFQNDVYLNPHYYIGSLLVLSGFLSLVVFLSNAFQGHFLASIDTLRMRDRETKDKMQELSRLYDISLGINAVMTVETLLKMVAKEVTILLSQPWAGIVLFNQQRETTHAVIVGLPEEHNSNFGSSIRPGGFTEWMYRHKKPVIVEDAINDRRMGAGEFPETTKVRSFIGLPLSTGQHIIGVIYVGDFIKKEFEERHLRVLTVMTDQLAIAIAKSKLYESIQRKIRNHERKIQSLEKVNHLKSEYVSHVSHELRTPLTSIKAYVETLVNHAEDPKFGEKKLFLGIVARETERLIRIVNDILDVSSIEFGQRPLQRASVNIEELISAVVLTLQPTLNHKRIKLETILPDRLPKISVDQDLITQVFINLINNAVKYSPEDTTIRVRVKEEAVDLSVSIEDEGIGIPEAQIEKIFERYFRVKSEQSRHFDGVGLGLAIVKNIIEQHGGTISVMSEENIGSAFTFSIPKEHCVNEILGYISQRVSDKTDVHDMLTLIVRMIAELVSAKIVSLMLLDHSRSELFIKVSFGLDEKVVEETRVKVGEGIAGTVVESGMPLLIDNIEKNEIYRSANKSQYETMSLLSVPVSLGNTVIGVINVNNKISGEPFHQDDMNLILSFAERISKALERMQTMEDPHAYMQDTVDAFRKLLERQIQTGAIEQIVDLAVKVAKKLNLSQKEIRVIQYVASVHDIGMTKVSDEILNKTFHLNSDEINEIRRHPQRGAELIRPLEFVELVSNIILHHHERVDGLGYPMGLKGDEIPIGARILAIIDAYQSMTSERPYRDKMSCEHAVKELVDCAGKDFDADVVNCFVEVLADEGTVSIGQKKKFMKMLREVVPGSVY